MCCTTASKSARFLPSCVTKACPTMISACCRTPTNCGSSSATVGVAINSRVTKSVTSAPHRAPERIEQPPRRDEQDGDHTSGQVHREHSEQGQHGQRDAVAVPQRGDDQHHGRQRRGRTTVEIGHRRGVELDVGDRGERRRDRRRGRRRARAAPFVGARAQQMPRQRRGADGEQPDRRGHRAERVGRGRRGPGDQAQHRAERVKCRGVVERFMGFDVAKLAHVGR